MIDVKRNSEINKKISAIYEKNTAEFLSVYSDAFQDKNPPCRINEFGIIDENRYDTDNGIMIIGKETNKWGNEEFENEILFRSWMKDVSKTGLADRGHIKKHPIMWYNIGRWLTAINNPDKEAEEISKLKDEAIHNLGLMAYTNINKVRGGSVSKKEYSKIAYSEIAGKVLKAEIDIIKPKIIVCCGTWRVVCYHIDVESLTRNGIKVVCMPHPAARKSSGKMIEDLRMQLNNFT